MNELVTPLPLDAHDAVQKVQQLQSLTGRDDLTGPILEEIVRKNTKLSEAEIQLAKMIAVPAWKFLWGKIKQKFFRGNPAAN